MPLETASYPGVVDPVGYQAVRTLGVFPDKSFLWFNPEAQVGAISGNGDFEYGNEGQNVISVNCQADSLTYRASMRGHVVALVLLDRRELWKFARISGAYNINDTDGTLLNPKNPQELAELLLDSMGETGYDVTALPTTGDLEFIWDYAESRMELARLCQYFGCDVCLKLDDSVEIVLLGAGAAPVFTSHETSIAISADPKQLPERLRFIAGDTLVECKIMLEAIGQETDGLIVNEDDLSYKPAAGWGDWNEFTDVDDPDERALAARYIGKAYRIRSFIGVSMEVPGLGVTLDDIRQILPLKPYRMTAVTDTNRPSKPVLGGFFWIEGNPPRAENVEEYTELHEPFTLDEANGIVLLSRPKLKTDEYGNWVPAELYLTAAFPITYLTTLLRERQERTLAMGGPLGEFIVREDTIYRRIIVSYDSSDPLTEDTISDNETAVNNAGDDLLDAVALQFATVTSGAISYRTTLLIDTSGLVRQVMWTCSTEQGFDTHISLGCDGLPYIRRLSDRELWRSSRQSVPQETVRSLRRLLADRGIA